MSFTVEEQKLIEEVFIEYGEENLMSLESIDYDGENFHIDYLYKPYRYSSDDYSRYFEDFLKKKLFSMEDILQYFYVNNFDHEWYDWGDFINVNDLDLRFFELFPDKLVRDVYGIVIGDFINLNIDLSNSAEHAYEQFSDNIYEVFGKHYTLEQLIRTPSLLEYVVENGHRKFSVYDDMKDFLAYNKWIDNESIVRLAMDYSSSDLYFALYEAVCSKEMLTDEETSSEVIEKRFYEFLELFGKDNFMDLVITEKEMLASLMDSKFIFYFPDGAILVED